MSWVSFLRYQKGVDVRAATLLRVGGNTSRATKVKLNTQLKHGKITHEEHHRLTNACNEFSDRNAQEELRAIPFEGDSDWTLLSEGCYRRKIHKITND